MDLIFWRHAEADDWTEGCDDLQRSLTSRGEKQAKRMAAWLDRQLPEGTRIVCSPARRCEQTALALGRKFKMRSELGPDTTPYRLVTKEHVATVDVAGTPYLRVAPEGLTLLAKEAMHDIAHFLRPGHLAQLRTILDDPEASANDRRARYSTSSTSPEPSSMT
jgi:hypothetical protein